MSKQVKASKETREADVFIKQSFQIITRLKAHKELWLGAGALTLALVAGSFLYTWWSGRAEQKAQESYYSAESAYYQLKDQRQAAKAEYEQKKGASNKGQKKTTQTIAQSEHYPSGDLQKDYGASLAELNQVIEQHRGTKAAVLAAFLLAEIYGEHQKYDEAAKALDSVASRVANKEPLAGLLYMIKGNVLSQSGNCAGAVQEWQKIAATSAVFLQGEALLRQAVCYQSMGDIGKAKDLYAQVAKDDAKSLVTKQALQLRRSLALQERQPAKK